MLKRCIAAGARNIDKNKAYVNELNVFPVPDGDTGTNMSMTLMTAAEAVMALEDAKMPKLVKTFSSGSLRGARGNSGVILSQLIRGFCKAVGDSETIDTALIAVACQRAIETAYKAVMKPKEGTILTVARAIADKAAEKAPLTKDPAELIEEALNHGKAVLKQTPDMLPVLKEAGVVDSGGQGLICLMEGVLSALKGEETSLGLTFSDESGAAGDAHHDDNIRTSDKISTDDIKFGYCTEFIVNLSEPCTAERVAEFKAFLESMGDSIVCVDDDELIKVHVHTNHPGTVIEKGLEIGVSLSRLKIDNMREEHEEKLIKNASRIAAMEMLNSGAESGKPDQAAADTAAESNDAPVEETPDAAAEAAKLPHVHSAVIAICTGKGFEEIFKSLGARSVIEGGQTMNPSTEDILRAVDAVNADEVYILPNNKNIILAAEQAARIDKDISIHVVPTKTIPQGIAAMINYNEELTADENMDAMTEAVAQIKTGELTYAVRNTVVDGINISEGDIMGIGDRGILAVGEILNDTALEMLESMIDEDSAMVTIYAGEGIDDESMELLADRITETYPDVEVETERGEQPVYYYIISVE